MQTQNRLDSRSSQQLRQVTITPNKNRYAEGSVIVEFGHTHVLCTASVDATVPKWLAGTQKGWISAEYGMLPRSTHQRISREKGSSSGRTQEISRLISRSLRAAVDLKKLGERQILIDCDVLQADGGTRTAAITGGFVALALALQKLKYAGLIQELPLVNYVAAVSVGLTDTGPLLDLCYEEDSTVETDMNFVMTSQEKFIEIQGTAEGDPFALKDMLQMVELATLGCRDLFAKQSALIGDFFPLPGRP